MDFLDVLSGGRMSKIEARVIAEENALVEFKGEVRPQIRQLFQTKGEQESVIAEQEQVIQRLRAAVPPEDLPVDCPEWLREDPNAYVPKQNLVKADGSIASVSFPATTMYPRQDYFNGLLKMRGWRELPSDEAKFYAIWDYVINRISYVNDKEEDWRLAMVTDAAGFGDCEDGTILFVTLARMAGISADKVFNACGTINGIGHSFPVCVHEDGGLYVYESTLNSTPGKPLALKGSKYLPSWGFANWRFTGFLKDSPTAGGGKMKLSKEDAEKKKKAIEEEWEGLKDTEN